MTNLSQNVYLYIVLRILKYFYDFFLSISREGSIGRVNNDSKINHLARYESEHFNRPRVTITFYDSAARALPVSVMEIMQAARNYPRSWAKCVVMHVHLILDLRFSRSLLLFSPSFATHYNYAHTELAIGSFRSRRSGAYCIPYRPVMSCSAASQSEAAAAAAAVRDTLPMIIRGWSTAGGTPKWSCRLHSRRDRKCVLCAG